MPENEESLLGSVADIKARLEDFLDEDEHDLDTLAADIFDDTKPRNFYYLTREEWIAKDLERNYSIEEEEVGTFRWFDGEYPVNRETIEGWSQSDDRESQCKYDLICEAFDIALEEAEERLSTSVLGSIEEIKTRLGRLDLEASDIDDLSPQIFEMTKPARFKSGFWLNEAGQMIDRQSIEDLMMSAAERREKATNYLLIEAMDKTFVIGAEPVFLDTETTGLHYYQGDDIVEIAIVSQSGEVLLNSLVNPGRPIPGDATAIHGITDQMVEDAPTIQELMPRIVEALRGKVLVVYNVEFDWNFLPDEAQSVVIGKACVMKRFAQWYGEKNEYYGGWRWQKLGHAAEIIGHKPEGEMHRALADAHAARAVWQYLNSQVARFGRHIYERQLKSHYESKTRTAERILNLAFVGHTVKTGGDWHGSVDAIINGFASCKDFMAEVMESFNPKKVKEHLDSGRVTTEWVERHLMGYDNESLPRTAAIDWISRNFWEPKAPRKAWEVPKAVAESVAETSSLDSIPF
jgi:DNA polymerase III epsilon subunit-like protein